MFKEAEVERHRKLNFKYNKEFFNGLIIGANVGYFIGKEFGRRSYKNQLTVEKENYGGSSRRGGYTCTWSLKCKRSAEEVMEIFKKNPKRVFPFPIRAKLNTNQEIIRGEKYDLYPLVFRKDSVEVTESTPTSFTFKSLNKHFHGSDATIVFRVLENSQQLYLQQKTDFKKRWFTPILAGGAHIVWWSQARRLSRLVKS